MNRGECGVMGMGVVFEGLGHRFGTPTFLTFSICLEFIYFYFVLTFCLPTYPLSVKTFLDIRNHQKAIRYTVHPPESTVDGSEIRRSPVQEKVVYRITYQGFSTIPGGCLGFLNHQTVCFKQYDTTWNVYRWRNSLFFSDFWFLMAPLP